MGAESEDQPPGWKRQQRRVLPPDEDGKWEGYDVEGPETEIRREDFVLMDGLRLVKPYHFDFVANVKQRWHGKTLVDIFAQEFPNRSAEYYEQAVRQGRLRIQGMQVGVNHTAKNGQRCRHFVHRHEPPVTDQPVQIIKATEDIVAINKPPSIPVHVAGQYRKNTILGILQAEHPELGALHCCHRLDKGVSGLLVLARSSKAANVVRSFIERGDVVKVYVARVAGVFPEEEMSCNCSLTWDPKANMAGCAPQDSPESHDLKAKAAFTSFKRLHLSPDGKTTVVECRPKTGRTHQIRVHLKHLGYPIANDSQYGGAHGSAAMDASSFRRYHQVQSKSHDLCSEQDDATQCRVKRQKGEDATSIGHMALGPCQPGASRGSDEDVALELAKTSYRCLPLLTLQDLGLNAEHAMDGACLHCPSIAPTGYSVDFQPIWLHARSYTFGDGRKFYSELPEWAQPEEAANGHKTSREPTR